MSINHYTQRVKLALFRLGLLPSEEERFNRWKGTEETFSVGIIGDGKFYLRMHDNLTPGGLRLCPEAEAQAVPLPPATPINVTNVNELPDTFPDGTLMAFIDVSTGAADFDFSAWAPTGLADGAHVRVRKVDGTPTRIVYTDNTGVTYNFVNQRTEFISLVYEKTTGLLHVI